MKNKRINLKTNDVVLVNDDCLNYMNKMSSNCIDLTITSPPYDNLRNYEDSLEWNENIWKSILEELYRVTKKGGVLVWIVADATINGSETGTSFKQVLYAIECGFNLYDTMIWNKNTCPSIGSLKRYSNEFEYMFILSKGFPKTVNIIKDKKNKGAGGSVNINIRLKDGTTRRTSKYERRTINEYGRRSNVWKCNTSIGIKEHPATFPESLIYDHIISWSNEGDTIFDPMLGSGTTGKVAFNTNRRFIGIEKVKKYYKLAQGIIKCSRNNLL